MANYLTQDDVNNFGHELLDVAQRAAQHAMGPELQRLHDENQALHDEVTRSTKMAIDRELDAAVPNWREINNSEQFHQWLLMPEPYSGVIRDRLLKDAANAGNAQRVIAFFQGFIAHAGAAGQASAGASPRTRRAPSGLPFYSREQIKKASDDFRRGRYSEQEYARLSAEFVRAGREGRILNPEPLGGLGSLMK